MKALIRSHPTKLFVGACVLLGVKSDEKKPEICFGSGENLLRMLDVADDVRGQLVPGQTYRINMEPRGFDDSDVLSIYDAYGKPIFKV